MRKLALALLILFSVTCFAQNRPDPCQNINVPKLSVAINLTSAATSALVAVSGNTHVYVCGFTVTILGLATTAGTIEFEQGTGTACASNAAALTGTFQGTTTAGGTISISSGSAMTQFSTLAANGLCAVTTGTSPSFEGYVTYVQQ